MKLHILFIFLLVVTLLYSCDNSMKYQRGTDMKMDTLKLLTQNNWNIVVPPSDSNLYSYNNQPLYFTNDYGYFFNQKIAKLSLAADSIFLKYTTYTATVDGIDTNPNVTTFLTGKIEKISRDSLIIRKIYGWGNPFYFNDTYVFYNDSLIYDPKLKINSIIFSRISLDSGHPSTAFEIFSDGTLDFIAGRNSKSKGKYKSVYDTVYFKNIQNEVRMANIAGQPDNFSVPMDAGYTEIIIYYNDSLRKEIKGYSGNFPPRLKNIVSLSYELYKNARIDRMKTGVE